VSDVLSRRALNRATLERQLLLRRATLSPLDAVEHLIGLQAQVPLNPYTALWSRLEEFRPEALAELLEQRQVVRIAVMRATIHLVTADDCLLLRPLMQPVLDAELARYRDLRGVDVDAVLAFARELVAERPRSGGELRAALAERLPRHDAADLAYACRNLLAFVQVPPRGVWGQASQVSSTTAEAWLGRPLVSRPSIDDVVLRYLGAFGPATVADVSTWSRLTGLREVLERLRPRLRTFRDERGRELFDLPDGPRPDPDTPAPVRFLPEYDNVLLSHADRSRFIARDDRTRLGSVTGPIHGSVLHDGFAFGLWRLERDAGSATLVINHARRMTKRAAAAVAAEGRRLLRFVAAEVDVRDVRFAAVD
jgi:DNA glycosylase AlkZ-like